MLELITQEFSLLCDSQDNMYSYQYFGNLIDP